MIFYNLGIWLLHIGVYIASLFNKKIQLFRKGREGLFQKLEANIQSKPGSYVWIHCASLGEFELALPLIVKIKKQTSLKILVTFFSPSGYEIRKDSDKVDAVFYLPLDFKSNAKRFVDIVKPKFVIFSKYDFWINYINVLHEAKIPTFAISSYFYKGQIYFKSYGGFYRKALRKLSHYFVINSGSVSLLKSIDIDQVTQVGDNRFDKVMDTAKTAYENDYIDEFKEGERLLIVGSAWPEDIDMLKNLINQKTFWWKVIIAPHDISEKNLSYIHKAINKDIVRYSQAQDKCLHCHQVMLIDNVGMLSKLYRYAEVAYIGGAFKQGLHNILEPIAHGLPVICGPEIQKFPEALTAKQKGGLFNIANAKDFEETFAQITAPERLKSIFQINTNFAQENLGATDTIYNALEQKGLLNL